MGEHTPGPWMATPADMFGDHNIVLRDSDDARAIAAVVSNLRPADEVQANAHLIAAAPDLLEPARDAADLLERYADFIRTVKADKLERHPYLPEIERVVEELRAAIAKAEGR